MCWSLGSRSVTPSRMARPSRESSFRALEGGMTVEGTLEVLAEFRRGSDAPIVLFSYLNPLLRYGLAAFLSDAEQAGAQGLLLTDVPTGRRPAGRGRHPHFCPGPDPPDRSNDPTGACFGDRGDRTGIPLLHLQDGSDRGP